ncbi:hypothetical protein PCASD_05518 [Puccinia coronata f. sp. avenae]|uniref:Tc1-like transposase DDE domain-containing protein n=1 Tax=Puccinia coronata f. sp. avenae TaxID=200324 RepID=A0A2N5UVN7_9BASI|nr:hypothetical protein PCASD_05518 [Puccinia coronata f. sp. avenae]
MTKHLGNLEQPLAEPSKATDCFWSKILSLQSDFVSENPLLQMVIKEVGHICLFFPKFHCELNPIELFWLYIKNLYWHSNHKFSTWKEYQALFEHTCIACPLSTIWKYFQHVD